MIALKNKGYFTFKKMGKINGFPELNDLRQILIFSINVLGSSVTQDMYIFSRCISLIALSATARLLFVCSVGVMLEHYKIRDKRDM